MKVLIFGANGMLGYAVSEYMKRQNIHVAPYTRKEFDIAKDSLSKLMNVIEESDAIINCAGIIKPMIQKNSPEEVLKVNGVFPKNLAKLTNGLGKKLIHITTDCVYSGKDGKYSEISPFDAEDLYGISKNAGENAECMTIRTSIIGEEKNQNFRSLLEWAKGQRGNEVTGFTNHKWNGITTVYLSEALTKIISNENLYQKGIFHLHSPNTLNKYELLDTINQVYQLDLKIKPKEVGEVCDRSLSSEFNFSRTLITKDIKTQIQEMKEFFTQG